MTSILIKAAAQFWCSINGLFLLDCPYEEYACETECMSYTTMCDGVQDCVMDEVVFDELDLVCSGEV